MRFFAIARKSIVLFLFIMSSICAYAAEYYVTTSGSGDGSSWSKAMGPQSFIQKLENASDGDVFNVASGEYRVNCTISKSVTIKGSATLKDKYTTVFLSDTDSNNGLITIKDAENVRFESICFKYGKGILGDYKVSLELYNCRFDQTKVPIRKAGNLTVVSCHFKEIDLFEMGYPSTIIAGVNGSFYMDKCLVENVVTGPGGYILTGDYEGNKATSFLLLNTTFIENSGYNGNAETHLSPNVSPLFRFPENARVFSCTFVNNKLNHCKSLFEVRGSQTYKGNIFVANDSVVSFEKFADIEIGSDILFSYNLIDFEVPSKYKSNQACKLDVSEYLSGSIINGKYKAKLTPIDNSFVSYVSVLSDAMPDGTPLTYDNQQTYVDDDVRGEVRRSLTCYGAYDRVFHGSGSGGGGPVNNNFYVTTSGTGSGSSWSTAMGPERFASKLIFAPAGSVFHIAEGVYTPKFNAEYMAKGNLLYIINNGVTLIGGYSEKGSTRDPKKYKTILTDSLKNGLRVIKIKGKNKKNVTLKGIRFEESYGIDGDSVVTVVLDSCFFENTYTPIRNVGNLDIESCHFNSLKLNDQDVSSMVAGVFGTFVMNKCLVENVSTGRNGYVLASSYKNIKPEKFVMTNSTFIGNTMTIEDGLSKSLLYCSTNSQLYNNTFVNNKVLEGHKLFNFDYKVSFIGNIVVANPGVSSSNAFNLSNDEDRIIKNNLLDFSYNETSNIISDDNISNYLDGSGSGSSFKAALTDKGGFTKTLALHSDRLSNNKSIRFPLTETIVSEDQIGRKRFSNTCVGAYEFYPSFDKKNVEILRYPTCEGSTNGTLLLPLNNVYEDSHCFIRCYREGILDRLTANNYELGAAVSIKRPVTTGFYRFELLVDDNIIDVYEIEIKPKNDLTISFSVDGALCKEIGGAAIAKATGGIAPYTFVWESASAVLDGESVTGLVPNVDYTVTVTDANNCTNSKKINVGYKKRPTLTASSTYTNPLCYGSKDGSISVKYSGNTNKSKLKLSVTDEKKNTTILNGNEASGTFTVKGLSAGLYTITLDYEEEGCGSTLYFVRLSDVTLVAPSKLQIKANVNDALCLDDKASAKATASGGTSPYTYAWKYGTDTKEGSSVTGLMVNADYTLTATDKNGCKVSTTVTTHYVEKPKLTATKSYTNPLCNGSSNGVISVNYSGNTKTLPVKLVVTDAKGVAKVKKGSQSAGSLSIDGLPAGTYGVVFDYDDENCSSTPYVKDLGKSTLTDPKAVTLTVTTVDALCSALGGSASAVAANGTPTYTYTWKNGTTTKTGSSVSGLVPNSTYTVTVSDKNGCKASKIITIAYAERPTLTAKSSFVKPSCNGKTDGSISISYSGNDDKASVKFTVTNAKGVVKTVTSKEVKASLTVKNLAAGTYKLSFDYDESGCSSTPYNVALDDVTLTAPKALSVSVTTEPAECAGVKGRATAAATGGNGDYSYTWKNNDDNVASGPITNLAAGDYTVVVTDSKGCTASKGLTVDMVIRPALKVTAPVVEEPHCNGDKTGVIGFDYSGNSKELMVVVTAKSADNVYTTYDTNEEAHLALTGMAAGKYTLSLGYNVKGCSSFLDEINMGEVTVAQPSKMSLTLAPSNAIGTRGGSATASVSGGTKPYYYQWLDDSSNELGTSSVVEDLAPEKDYSLCVTDVHGCAVSESFTIKNAVNPSIDVDAKRFFVKKTGSGNGSNWKEAMSPEDFVKTLSVANQGATFYVAEGTYDFYKITEGSEITHDYYYNEKYKVKNGVNIIGGYPKNVLSEDIVSDPKNYPTVISSSYEQEYRYGSIEFGASTELHNLYIDNLCVSLNAEDETDSYKLLIDSCVFSSDLTHSPKGTCYDINISNAALSVRNSLFKGTCARVISCSYPLSVYVSNCTFAHTQVSASTYFQIGYSSSLQAKLENNTFYHVGGRGIELINYGGGNDNPLYLYNNTFLSDDAYGPKLLGVVKCVGNLFYGVQKGLVALEGDNNIVSGETIKFGDSDKKIADADFLSLFEGEKVDGKFVPSLKYNGGYTPTVKLLSDTLADGTTIRLPQTLTGVSTDQRGEIRHEYGCPGAYEKWDTVRVDVEESICRGEIYKSYGFEIEAKPNMAGVQTYERKSKGLGCDSVITLTLNVSPVACSIDTKAMKYFVKKTGKGDGSSWKKAMGPEDFVGALSVAKQGATFYVAEGTYDFYEIAGNEPKIDYYYYEQYKVKNGVNIIGGYPNGVTSDDVPSDPKNHPTVISSSYEHNYRVASLDFGGSTELHNLSFDNLCVSVNDSGEKDECTLYVDSCVFSSDLDHSTYGSVYDVKTKNTALTILNSYFKGTCTGAIYNKNVLSFDVENCTFDHSLVTSSCYISVGYSSGKQTKLVNNTFNIGAYNLIESGGIPTNPMLIYNNTFLRDVRIPTYAKCVGNLVNGLRIGGSYYDSGKNVLAGETRLFGETDLKVTQEDFNSLLEGEVIDGKFVPTLKNNGGYTPTVKLLTDVLPDSSLIRFPLSSTIVTTDQRGESRMDMTCVGAYEIVCNTSDEQKALKALSISLSSVDQRCYGIANGQIEATVKANDLMDRLQFRAVKVDDELTYTVEAGASGKFLIDSVFPGNYNLYVDLLSEGCHVGNASRDLDTVLNIRKIAEPFSFDHEYEGSVQPSCASLNNGQVKVKVLNWDDSYLVKTYRNGKVSSDPVNILTNVLEPANAHILLTDQPSVLHSIVVRDACKNKDSITVELRPVSAPKIVATLADSVLACNDSKGFVVLDVTGGNPATSVIYVEGVKDSIRLSGDTTIAFNNLEPGQYNIHYKNKVVGCADDATFSMNVAPQSAAFDMTVELDGEACAEQKIKATVSGGAEPYASAVWTRVENDKVLDAPMETLEGVGLGSYYLTVVDANECKYVSDTITANLVNNEYPLGSVTVAVDSVDNACFGAKEGKLVVNIDGNSNQSKLNIHIEGADYAADSLVTESAASFVFEGLSAGKYVVSLAYAEADDCENDHGKLVKSIEVKQPAKLVATPIVTGAICTEAGGSVNMEVKGGVLPYGYQWTDEDGALMTVVGEAASGLVPGKKYSCTVTDANGCVVETEPVEIPWTEIDNIEVGSFAAVVNPQRCYGVADGNIEVSVKTNVAPANLRLIAENMTTGSRKSELANADGKVVIDSLVPGDYAIYLDYNNENCPTTNSAVKMDTVLTVAGITGKFAIDKEYVVAEHPTCYSAPNGKLGIRILNWNANCSIEMMRDGVEYGKSGNADVKVDEALTAYFTTSEQPGGLQCLVVSDGCENTDTLKYPLRSVAKPEIIEVSADSVLACSDSKGSVTLKFVNAVPEASSIVNGSEIIRLTGDETVEFNNLSAGRHDIYYKSDIEGCFDEAVYTIKVTAPDTLEATPIVAGAICAEIGGTITIEVKGGTEPYTYQWTNEEGDIMAEVGNKANKLEPEKKYSCKVIDANGCTVEGNAVEITWETVEELEITGVVPSVIDQSCYGVANGQISAEIKTNANTANLKMIAENVETGIRKSGFANAAGKFLVDSLVSGDYRLMLDYNSEGCPTSHSAVKIDTVLSVAGVTKQFAIDKDYVDAKHPSCYNDPNGKLGIRILNWNANCRIAMLRDSVEYGKASGSDVKVDETSTAYFATSGQPGGLQWLVVSDGCENTDTMKYALRAVTAPQIVEVAADSVLACNYSTSGFAELTFKTDHAQDMVIYVEGSDSTKMSADTTIKFNNLTIGNYNIHLSTLVEGCSDGVVYTMNVKPESEFKMQLELEGDACLEQKLNATVSGGALPYASAVWTKAENNKVIEGASLETLEGVGVGSFFLTVVDANACKYVSDTIKANLMDVTSQFGTVTITADSVDNVCYGLHEGKLMVNLEGNTYNSELNIHVEGADYVTDSLVSIASGVVAFNNLPAGKYVVKVTYAGAVECEDGNGYNVLTKTINQSAKLEVSPTVTAALCEEAGGSVSLTVSGGVEPYTYQWSNADGPIALIEASAEALKLGTYACKVTDANNCMVEVDDMLVELATLESLVNVVVTPKAIGQQCYGVANGSIEATVNAKANAARLKLVIENIDTKVQKEMLVGESGKVIFDALEPGDYKMTLDYDYEGCAATQTAIVVSEQLTVAKILAPLAIDRDYKEAIDPTCYNEPNGKTAIRVNNWAETYTATAFENGAKLKAPAMTAQEDGVLLTSTGLYGHIEMAIADVCGNSDTMKFDLKPLTKPTVALVDSFIKLKCSYSTDGFLKFNVSGGHPETYKVELTGSKFTKPFEYAESILADNLSANTYTFTYASTLDGCTDKVSKKTTISVPKPMKVFSAVSPLVCNEEAAGEISFLPYRDGELHKVKYDVEERSKNYALEIYKNEDSTIQKAFMGVKSVKVSAKNQNEATLKATLKSALIPDEEKPDSLAPKTFPLKGFWKDDAGDTIPVAWIGFDMLPADVYYITTTDTANCQFVDSIIIDKSPTYNTLVFDKVTFNAEEAACKSDKRRIEINVSGGWGEYAYSIADLKDVNADEDNLDGNFGGVAMVDPSAAGDSTYEADGVGYYRSAILEPGTYQITVTDAYGCMQTYSEDIVVKANMLVDGEVLMDRCDPTEANIINAVAKAAEGYQAVAPYSFKATYNDKTVERMSADGTVSIDSIPNGVVGIWVTDANQCEGFKSFEVRRDDSISILTVKKMEVIDNKCFDDLTGAVVFKVYGGNPAYTDFILDGESLSHDAEIMLKVDGKVVTDKRIKLSDLDLEKSDMSSLFCMTNMRAGDHKLTIADKEGCATSINFTLAQPEMLEVEALASGVCPGKSAGEAMGRIYPNTVTGGVKPYKYALDYNEASGDIFEDNDHIEAAEGDEHVLYVQDANGCVAHSEAVKVEGNFDAGALDQKCMLSTWHDYGDALVVTDLTDYSTLNPGVKLDSTVITLSNLPEGVTYKKVDSELYLYGIPDSVSGVVWCGDSIKGPLWGIPEDIVAGVKSQEEYEKIKKQIDEDKSDVQAKYDAVVAQLSKKGVSALIKETLRKDSAAYADTLATIKMRERSNCTIDMIKKVFYPLVNSDVAERLTFWQITSEKKLDVKSFNYSFSMTSYINGCTMSVEYNNVGVDVDNPEGHYIRFNQKDILGLSCAPNPVEHGGTTNVNVILGNKVDFTYRVYDFKGTIIADEVKVTADELEVISDEDDYQTTYKGTFQLTGITSPCIVTVSTGADITSVIVLVKGGSN